MYWIQLQWVLDKKKLTNFLGPASWQILSNGLETLLTTCEADKNILTDIVIVRILGLWPVKARASTSTIIHNF